MKPLVFLCKLWLSVFKKEKKACNCTFHKPQMSSFHLWFKWLHHRTLLTPHVSPCFTVKRANSSKTLQRFCKYCCLWRPFLVMIRKQTKHLVSLNRERGGVYFESCHPRKGAHTRAPSERAHAQHCWPADSLSSALPGNLPSSYISTTLHFLADSCTANMHN